MYSSYKETSIKIKKVEEIVNRTQCAINNVAINFSID